MPKNKVYKTKDGRYDYYVTDASGKRKQLKSRVNETLRDFKARCDLLDREAEGTVTSDTMDDLFQLWIDQHVKPKLSASEIRVTVPIYDSYIKPYLGHRRLSEISRADVYSVLSRAASLGKSASYIKKIRGCVSRPYNWGINALGLNLIAPTQGLVFSSNSETKESKSRVISSSDMDRIIAAAEHSKYSNYFKILSLTGLRPSEALGLQIKDIKADHLEIRRGWTIDGYSDLKTASARRDIPLADNLKQILHHQREISAFRTQEGWLFATLAGQPDMTALISSFKRILKRTAVWTYGGKTNRKKIDCLHPPVQCSLYDFRHTFATRAAEAGMHQTALKAIMGHSDISITLKYYIGLTDSMLQQVKEIMSSLA